VKIWRTQFITTDKREHTTLCINRLQGRENIQKKKKNDRKCKTKKGNKILAWVQENRWLGDKQNDVLEVNFFWGENQLEFRTNLTAQIASKRWKKDVAYQERPLLGHRRLLAAATAAAGGGWPPRR
jgi:hypothetical protein